MHCLIIIEALIEIKVYSLRNINKNSICLPETYNFFFFCFGIHLLKIRKFRVKSIFRGSTEITDKKGNAKSVIPRVHLVPITMPLSHSV